MKIRLVLFLTCSGLLFEEHPDAYKNIDDVIADMVSMGMIQVIAVLTHVFTYKSQTPAHDGDD